jgi:hypothetical protein
VAGSGVLGWLFRNRQTGDITVAQRPNGPLLVFLVAWALRIGFAPSGSVDDGLAVVATGALVIWAVDELVRGVNPWRRILGGAVLTVQVVGLVSA